METMQILHVYKDYHPVLGGIENHIKALAESQVADGHEVVVLVTNPGHRARRETYRGVHIIRAPRLATVASTPLSLTFPLIMYWQQTDITHLHFPYPIGELSQLLLGRARPYVITYHSDVVRQKRILRAYRPLLRAVLRGANRILVTSDRYVRTSPFLRRFADKCTVVPLSVNPSQFGHAEATMPPSPVPTLLFVGRHRYYKGIDVLLQALVDLPARLLVAGDGPMRRQWEELAKALGVAERTYFLGDVSDEALPGLYASGDIFVLPATSRAEAFGKVLLEAMAAGLPCVTTELGTGTSYVVQDGHTGLVVQPRRPGELSAALRRLIDDENLRRRLGRSGRDRVEQMFTVEKMSDRVARVYDEVLS